MSPGSLLSRHLSQFGWNRLLFVLLLLWLAVLCLTMFPVYINRACNTSINDQNRVMEKLAKSMKDLDVLRKQNQELRDILNVIVNRPSLQGEQLETVDKFLLKLRKVENTINHARGPSTNYEKLRRRVLSNIVEFWSFIESSVLEWMTLPVLQQSAQMKSVDAMLRLGAEHKRSLLHDMRQITLYDGYNEWRKQEIADLSALVQKRLSNLQNPSNCNKARRLVCDLNKGCGYGCELHHVVYCFMVAYGAQRTLILKSRGWRYSKGGWETVFLPVSNTCTETSGETVFPWPATENTLVISLPIIDSLSHRPPYLPLAVPKDLAVRLERVHGAPIVWWVGQILKYLLRPQLQTSDFLKERMKKLNFQSPIVGVHIRRTDKLGLEAAFHKIEEYMSAVDEYYNQLELMQPIEKRRVYIASDDPNVISEIALKYTNYKVIGDVQIAKNAAMDKRYTSSSLNGIINDIHFLSMTDYLVCTFSSQVCRVAYELMQTFHVDASARFHSLDDIYYYGGQNSHNVMAVLDHTAQESKEISFQKGDLIGIAGNHWNGYSKGTNRKTNKLGLYPSFKVIDRVETVEISANFSH